MEQSVAGIAGPVQQVNILRHPLQDDGTFPNNGLLPLMVYRKVLHLTADGDRQVKDLFESNGWTNAWTNGVYDYHHYHSTAHEVLGVIRGSSRIQFGGPKGISLLLEEGDVVIIPAGVAHKNLGGEPEFSCVGAYPDGQRYDINYGKNGERPLADRNIAKVPLPQADPVYGVDGPLSKNWMPEIEYPETSQD
jgi:uncharacterized protein YjlB